MHLLIGNGRLVVVVLAGARGDDHGGVQASSSLTSQKKWKKVRVSVCCSVGRVVGRWADCQLLRPSVHRVGLLACTAMVPVVVLSCSSKHSLLHKTLCQFT